MMKPSALDRIRLREEDPKELFEILESVGVGNFGVVLKARNRVTGDVVAVKQIPLNDTETEDLDTLVKEVEILQECDHPNVVRFHGTYQSLGVLWIVMEYCEGGSVDTVYDLLRRPLSEPLIAYVCRQMLLGLRYLHEHHIIHRDIKGSNVLLTKEGEVRLADFGVSTELKHTLSRRNSFIGTALWMAPEALTEKDYDSRADMWSLGITTIELAEGQPPHLGMHIARAVFVIPLSDPPTLHAREKWSPAMHAFLRRLLAKDKELRPSAATMLMDPFVSPNTAATQADMAAVVEQLLVRRRTIDEKRGGDDHSSNTSAMTIVTRASSGAGGDDDSAAVADGGGDDAAVHVDETAAQWVDEHVGPRRRGSPAAARAAAGAGRLSAVAGAAAGDRGAALGGRLVPLPLLHLDDMSFDALVGNGRTLFGSSGSGSGGVTATSASAISAGAPGAAPSSSGGAAAAAAAAAAGPRGGVAAAVSGAAFDAAHVAEGGTVAAAATNTSRYCHPSLLLPTAASGGGGGGGGGVVGGGGGGGGGPTSHEARMAAAAALGDALAETLFLLGVDADAGDVDSLRCVETTTTLRTVRTVFLHHHHLPYTRAVTDAEAKQGHRMRSLCGTVLKSVYASLCERTRDA
ncbi:protein kinase [Novymonas esmeraldas]|uniref:non-specific serine/threonine protein kinase n=1 Tax=Novymonas esmeraldas TaxID=1808958 RepID=A0AAW0EVW3_9TRYP